MKKQAEDALKEADEPTREAVEDRRRQADQDTMEELEAKRDEITAKLDCMISVSPAVVEAFKKRKDEVSYFYLFLYTIHDPRN